MGADAAGVDPAVGHALPDLLEDLLIEQAGPRTPGLEPGLIWGLAFEGGAGRAIGSCAIGPGFRWLHVNLADAGTRLWIDRDSALPAAIRELLLSADTHQQALVEGGAVGLVLHDLERDFDVADTARIGALRIALTDAAIVTARAHPLGSADIARQRLDAGAPIAGPAPALELIAGAIAQNIARVGRALSAEVQEAEDLFLEGRKVPGSRDLLDIRRRLAQLHRLLDGMRVTFRRLEEDDDLPEPLKASAEKVSQRLQGLDGDIVAIQGQLRLLRDEIDIQAAQTTNQNLYILSLMTALMLPSTLVTGIFGMNTGGLPLTGGPYGTVVAIGIAIAAALGTWWFLRALGFIRR